jgi:hypothetical protein
MDINERFISVRGKVAVDKSFDYGQDIDVTVTVTDILNTDNQDGTKDITYKCKLFEAE